MLSCSIRFSAPSFWMGGGLDSRCVGRVYGADGAVHGTIRTVHTTTTHPKTRCRKPYAVTQHLMLLIVGVYTETCRAKDTSLKLPHSIKLIISSFIVIHFLPVSHVSFY